MRLPLRWTLFVVLPYFTGTMDHAQAQASQNVELLGNWNGYVGPASSWTYSACWGYVAPDGREYAFIGTLEGTYIIEITNAPSLEQRAFIPGPLSSWREMKTYRHYAYIVSESSTINTGAGVQIVDLSGLPNSARLERTFVWRDTSSTGAITPVPAAHSVSVSENYLYLNGGGSYTGIRILDISTPLNPLQVGRYIGPYIHDSHIRNDTIFAAAIYANDGLDIIDARNKSNPQRIKLIQYAGSGTHNAWTSHDRQYVLTTDEIGNTPKTLKVWDIRNLQNPTKVAEVSRAPAIVHNVFVKGTLAYVAWYTAGLVVVDVANPSTPQIVGYYDTYPQSDAQAYAGAWGADPYFPSGKVIVSDMQTGLYVLRYTGDKRGKVVGKVADAFTGEALQDVLLHFTDASITRWTNDQGEYLFGYAPGTYSLRIEKPGYQPKTATVLIADGNTGRFDFTLSPLEPPILPTEFRLHQNFPNPFNTSTTITFDVPGPSRVRLSVFNILGQELALLRDGHVNAGTYNVPVDASSWQSGVYLYRLWTNETVLTKRMVLVR